MFDFINNELRESRLFRSNSALSKRTAEDITNITFLYFLALAIMKDEFETAPWVQNYLGNSFRYGRNFKTARRTDNDLYWCIHVIDQQKAELLNKKFDKENIFHLGRCSIPTQQMITWVKKSIKGTSTESDTSRFLRLLEKNLKINNQDYSALRRMVSSWGSLNNNQRKLVCTRLKFALNKHARMSEIYPEFDSYVMANKFFIKDAVDPESPAKKPSTIKSILTGAALGVGAGLVGSALLAMKHKNDNEAFRKRIRAMFKLDEMTSASSIASTTAPLGSVIKRPNQYFAKRGDRKKKSIFTS